MIYSWTFWDTKNRGKLWYIITFSCVIGLAIWGFLTKQYGMSFIVLLLAGLTFYIENNSADDVEVIITDLGIKVWEGFYDYSKIKSFTFIYSGEHALIIRLKIAKKGIASLDLNIDNTIATELKTILPQFIDENEQEDLSFTDKLIRMLKL